jgi:predicted metal-binding protein
MLKDDIIKAINDAGFDEYKEISSKDLIFSEDVFGECAKNTCGNYGKNHSCPPLSGDMQENMARFLKYENGIIINKIVDMGEFYEKMMTATKEAGDALQNLRDLLEDKPVLIAGPGGCRICKTCAAIDNEPCRFPDKRQYSMEGSGMDIVSMSRKFNMIYNAGDHKLGYFYIVMY